VWTSSEKEGIRRFKKASIQEVRLWANKPHVVVIGIAIRHTSVCILVIQWHPIPELNYKELRAVTCEATVSPVLVMPAHTQRKINA
jgi:hypothetical protein